LAQISGGGAILEIRVEAARFADSSKRQAMRAFGVITAPIRTAKTEIPDETERKFMPKYITLIRFTEQGAKNIKHLTARAFAEAVSKAGVNVEAQYWTAGSFDGALVLSADAERKVLHALTELAAAGNVRTETLQAFDAKEFEAMVGG
jgi:uncharacterized protein with GYD domain